MRQGLRPSSPLVGRTEELAAVSGALAAGGCVIGGLAGVGKSRLAAEAAGATGGPVLHVLATASGATVPFGAFGHLLPAGLGRSGPVIPEFLRWFRAAHGSGSSAFLVDDAHLLDDASATLLLAVATTGAAQVLATVRSGEPAPDAVTALWKEHGLDRIELQNFGRPDVAALLESLLDGPVHPSVVERVNELTLGNALYVNELVRDARRTSALCDVGGRWRWREELLEFDRLSALIERRVERVSSPARQALELIALGAPLPLPVVTGLTAAAAVEELDRLGLIELGDSHPADVAMAHPLYGEVVAAGIPRTAGIRLRRQLAAALGREDDGDILRVATWLLEAGEPDPALFIEASGLALRRGSAALALRLASACGTGLAPALAVATALIGLGRYDEVEPVLAAYEGTAAGADLETSIAYFEARSRALLRGSHGEEAYRSLLVRATRWHTGQDWSATVATLQGWVAVYTGKPHDALSWVAPYLDDATVGPRRRLGMLAVAANAQARLALIDDCLVTAAAVDTVAAAFAAPWEARYGSLVFEVTPRIAAGRGLETVEARLHETRVVASSVGDGALRAIASLALGELTLRRGHAAEAVTWYEEAADHLAGADPVNNELLALSGMAHAYGLLGEVAAAEAALSRVGSLGSRQPRNAEKHQAHVTLAQATVEAVTGRVSSAVRRLLAMVEAELQNPAIEIDGLYDAIRFGADPRSVLGPLQQRVAASQNELARLFVDHVQALAEGDATAQLDVARRFAGLGVDLFAAEAAAGAARAFAAEGRSASAREAAALAANYAEACPGVVTPGLRSAPELIPLTRREREVAVLAARGMSNREIADELVVSVRTVESCVLRACRKLGVDNRRALGAVLVG